MADHTDETVNDPMGAVDTPTPRRKPKPEVTTIGGRELKPSTLMMGHGYDPALSEGSLKAADLPHQHFRLRKRRRRASATSKASPASAKAAPKASSIRASTARTRKSSKIASPSGTGPRMRCASPAG